MIVAAPSLEIAVVVLGILLLMFDAFSAKTEKRSLAIAGIFGLGVVLAATWFLTRGEIDHSSAFWSFYTDDALAIFFKRLALVTTIAVLIMSIDYGPVVRSLVPGTTSGSGVGEFYALPVFTCAGLMWMASAIDFVMIFVSLELVTMSFYVLVSYTRRRSTTLEAGVKYLILSAVSTGFLVYGITWIFGVTGETNLANIARVLREPSTPQIPALFGIVLVLVGLGFKIAAVPFHIWVPDVYQGAPTPVTAFLSVGSKAGGFVVLLRVVEPFLAMPRMQHVIVAIAVLTLVVGNLAAMPQSNFKRLLAYSSIAHAGYLLIGIASLAGVAVSFYLASYLLMTLLSFAVLIVVARHTGEEIADFSGLAKRSPFLAFAMLISMLSLAGVPFTAGFFGKFMIFDAAIQQHQTTLVIVGVVTVACGFYYYLKVVRAMYWDAPSVSGMIPVSELSRGAMIAMIAGIFWLGVYPQPILNALHAQQSGVASAER
jgi:NADH-quinone oxidoreductase subunit N